VTSGGGDVAGFFAPASDFPVPGSAAEDAPGNVSAASKVAKGSWCAVASGFPLRNRGRLGSVIVSSVAFADADGDEEAGGEVFAGSAVAAGFVVADGFGGVGELLAGGGALVLGAGVGAGDAEVFAGFCSSFLFVSLF